jgi:hypothetical protein
MEDEMNGGFISRRQDAASGIRTTMGGDHAQSRQSTAMEPTRRGLDEDATRIKKFKAASCQSALVCSSCR